MATVEGTNRDDQIDGTYAGDPEGDVPTSGDDEITGGIGYDTILAGDGDDTVFGGAHGDKIWGEGGDDTLHGDEGEDLIFGGEGNDVLFGGAGNDTLKGGDGDDTLVGGEGIDQLGGGADADTIVAGAGDHADGGYQGNDNDTLDLSGVGPYRLENLRPDFDGNGQDGTVVLLDGEGNPTGETIEFLNIEHFKGGGPDGTVEGTAGDDIIDTHYTGDPDGDMVDNDDAILPGDTGNDDLIYGYGGDDTILAGDGDDLVYGGEGNDLITGGAGDDTLYGDEGNDTILGDAGNDTIFGGEGEDLMGGGDDRDVFYGVNGGDVVDGGSGGDDYDTLDLTGLDVDSITYVSDDNEDGYVTFGDGSTMLFNEIENVIPCFTPGTMIATPRGERAVEELREGDRIITRDNGIQEIRWTGRKDVTGRDFTSMPHIKPILIRAGALGNGLPERDMMVSPNHRLLVASDRTQLYFEESEVLAAAKHLVGLPGVIEVEVARTAYLHFMFDRHEVVLSNGAWTESFQPGDQTLNGLGNAQRNEIYEIFPELATQKGRESYAGARTSLKKHEAQLLVR